MKKFLLMFALATMMVSTAGATTTTDITLDQLVDNNWSMLVGDKLFSDFSFTRTCSGDDPFCLPADASGITVVPQDLNPLLHGIRFSGSFQAYGPNSVANFSIGYKVTVVPGSDNYATDMHLALSGVVIDCEQGAICNVLIGETLRDLSNNVIGQLQVTNTSLNDDAAFSPLKSFTVLKDISLTAISARGGDANVVKFSILDQIVSQEGTGNQVPEPGTYALMGAGLIGLAFLRRRKA